MRTSRTATGLLAGVAALVLAGCGTVHPGAAAVVGGTTITHSEVNELTRVQCALGTSGQQGGAARSTVQAETLNRLVEGVVDNRYGDEKGATVDRSLLQQQLDSARQAVAKLPQSEQEVLLGFVREYVSGQLKLIDLGRKSLVAKGTKSPGLDESFNEGSRLAGAYGKTLDISIDPRYNPGTSDKAGGGDGSISRPTSAYARSASRAATPDFLATLPSRLRCG